MSTRLPFHLSHLKSPRKWLDPSLRPVPSSTLLIKSPWPSVPRHTRTAAAASVASIHPRELGQTAVWRANSKLLVCCSSRPRESVGALGRAAARRAAAALAPAEGLRHREGRRAGAGAELARRKDNHCSIPGPPQRAESKGSSRVLSCWSRGYRTVQILRPAGQRVYVRPRLVEGRFYAVANWVGWTERGIGESFDFSGNKNIWIRIRRENVRYCTK